MHARVWAGVRKSAQYSVHCTALHCTALCTSVCSAVQGSVQCAVQYALQWAVRYRAEHGSAQWCAVCSSLQCSAVQCSAVSRRVSSRLMRPHSLTLLSLSESLARIELGASGVSPALTTGQNQYALLFAPRATGGCGAASVHRRVGPSRPGGLLVGAERGVLSVGPRSNGLPTTRPLITSRWLSVDRWQVNCRSASGAHPGGRARLWEQPPALASRPPTATARAHAEGAELVFFFRTKFVLQYSHLTSKWSAHRQLPSLTTAACPSSCRSSRGFCAGALHSHPDGALLPSQPQASFIRN